ncbi:MAG: SNF2 family N-terminal domain-containing protein [Benjaminiella poitrasii]|nr:MAG: SNF2 family N-terminal domain-containing protein [Benjaminiella poitrasii]
MSNTNRPIIDLEDSPVLIDLSSSANASPLMLPSSVNPSIGSPQSESNLVLELTEEERNFIRNADNRENVATTNNTQPGSSIENSIVLDDDTYAFFIEAGLENPEELTQLGIDVNEIRAQKSIADRLDREHRQSYEYAQQLQLQYNASYNGTSSPAAASPFASPSSASASLQQPLIPVAASVQYSASQHDAAQYTQSQPSPMSRPETVAGSSSTHGFSAGGPSSAYSSSFASSSTSTSGSLISGISIYGSSEASSSNSSSSAKREHEVTEEEVREAKRQKVSKGKEPILIPDDADLIDLTAEDEPAQDLSTPNTHNDIIVESDYSDISSDMDEDIDIPSVVDYLSTVSWGAGLTSSGLPLTNRSGFEAFPYPFAAEAGYMAGFRNSYKTMAGYPTFASEDVEKELRDLLENIGDDDPPPPEDRTGTPDGLRITLMEHQKIGLQWMIKMENSSNKGGILADDMGLGKTIQAMATIVEHPCPNPTVVPASKLRARVFNVTEDELLVRATLIVCPVSLMDQWRREIEQKTNPKLKVLVFHGPNRTSNPYELSKYDVVISSYAVTASNFQENFKGPLSKVKFHRIILDEAHTIKNKQTLSARGCCQVEATYRWCMTATPIQNKIDELYSLIKFLRIRPFCDWDEFRDTILKPLKSGNPRKAIKVAAVLMKAIALRRSKKAMIDGRPILDLPERNIHMTHINFSPDERIHYDFVDKQAQARLNKYIQAGTVMKNYSSVLVLLLRLRQACLHPALTVTEGDPDIAPREDEQLKAANEMTPEVVERLLRPDNQLDSVECPICMDTADNAMIVKGCGHILCRECLDNYLTVNGGIDKRCPQCRGEIGKHTSVPVELFIKIHAPHLLQEFEKAEEEEKQAEEKVKEFISSSKIEKMIEILDQTTADTNGQDKTIIFSQFTAFLDLLDEPLKQKGHKYLRYDGSMDINQRAETVNKFFEDPEYKVLLVSTKCGSLGLNLTCANRVILMDVWWNPALENQAIDRVHRIGQTKPVDVHRIFISNTVEDRILELQNKKQQIADGVLGEGTGGQSGRLRLEEMIYLLRGGPLPPSLMESNPNGEGSSRQG